MVKSEIAFEDLQKPMILNWLALDRIVYQIFYAKL